MGKIKKLASDEIQKIAAGEVVERPANIVKELVENSLDAGATNISVYAYHGGKTLIRVVDNGCGIACDDIELALTHHATSKLTTVDELNTIATFGFRGEALSSISSVAKMTFVTRDALALDAVQLKIDAGQVMQRSTIARDVGTDITVEDLFFNVPARRKFLKSDETEWNAIYKVVHALALSHINCGFKLFHNDRLVFQCQSSDTLIMRAKILFETESLLECEVHNGESFSVTGFISDVRLTRYDRSSIFVFANKRWIKNSKLTHAVIKGYGGVLPPARYPYGALFIEIDPSFVDVNIHPRKEEISFLHPRRIELALESMIKKTLENALSQVFIAKPTMPLFNSQSPVISPQRFDVHACMPQETKNTYATRVEQLPIHYNDYEGSGDQCHVQQSCLCPAQEIATQPIAMIAPTEFRIMGQLYLTYIMIEADNNLILIDQHAAHERILYELFAQRFHEVAVVSLLFPLIMNFTMHEAVLLEKYKSILSSYGLCFEQCGENQYALSALPVVLRDKNIVDMVREFLATCAMEDVADQELLKNKINHALRAQMACKAAVKAGDALSYELMHSLVEQLNIVDNRFSCPHGRPTIWKIGLPEIERKFKRRV